MVELTKDDCIKIQAYVEWLENIAEDSGYDVSGKYPADEYQKIITGGL